MQVPLPCNMPRPPRGRAMRFSGAQDTRPHNTCMGHTVHNAAADITGRMAGVLAGGDGVLSGKAFPILAALLRGHRRTSR